MIWVVLACAGTEPVPAETAMPSAERLVAPRLARRLSLDLRGVLPTVEELDRVEADPQALHDLRAAWLTDPRVEERLVDLWAERWHTRVDGFDIQAFDYGLTDEHAFDRSVGEEPLRVIARVAVEDRPLSDALSVDWTMGNDLLADIWPLDCDEGDGWRACRWTDGRPAAGVLATNGLWWRYSTDTFNQSRSRSAAVHRLLVCEDVAARPVSFTASSGLLDEGGAELAVRTDPACITCHATLDPTATALFGFFPIERYSVAEMTRYHPERERMGVEELGVEMAWAGTPVNGLADLGDAIGQDPRFARCAVETLAEGFWRRPVDVDDHTELAELTEAFVDADLRGLALVEAITASPSYAAPDARLLAPHVVADNLEDLTGFRWTVDGVDLVHDDKSGVRVLAAGVDGERVTRPQAEPGLTWMAVHVELAQGAAAHAVDHGGPILDGLDLTQHPDRAALADLHWRLYAQRPTEMELNDAVALFEALDHNGPRDAWVGLLTFLFLDARMLSA